MWLYFEPLSAKSSQNKFRYQLTLFSHLSSDSCKHQHVRIRQQTEPHGSGDGAVELSLTASHRWVSLLIGPSVCVCVFGGSSVFCWTFCGFQKDILLCVFLLPLCQNKLQKCHLWLLPCVFSEELCLELSRAVEAGDTQAASQHASALAHQKAALTIQLSEKNYADGEIRWDAPLGGGFIPGHCVSMGPPRRVCVCLRCQICVAVYLSSWRMFRPPVVSQSKCFPTWLWLHSSNRLEERSAMEPQYHKAAAFVLAQPTPALLLLHLQVFLEYGFHPRVQRWVIGQCLCTEPRSLASYGVQKDGDTAYLYLISARQARITRQLFQQDLESALLAPPLPPGNGPTSQDWRGYSTLPSRLPHNNQGQSHECPLSAQEGSFTNFSAHSFDSRMLKLEIWGSNVAKQHKCRVPRTRQQTSD